MKLNFFTCTDSPTQSAMTQYLPLKSVHGYENIITQRKNRDLRIRKRIGIQCSTFIHIQPLNRIQDTK